MVSRSDVEILRMGGLATVKKSQPRTCSSPMPVSTSSSTIHTSILNLPLVARGFARAGQGLPDEARAARYILKDYVAGKLLFAHPPPGIDEDTFNARARQLALDRLAASGKKSAPSTRVGKNADTFVDVDPARAPATTSTGLGGVLDREFFDQNAGLSHVAFVKGGQSFIRSTAFPHQNTVGNDGRMIQGGAREEAAVKGKKHNKGNKRAKQRSGKGYD